MCAEVFRARWKWARIKHMQRYRDKANVAKCLQLVTPTFPSMFFKIKSLWRSVNWIAGREEKAQRKRKEERVGPVGRQLGGHVTGSQPQTPGGERWKEQGMAAPGGT